MKDMAREHKGRSGRAGEADLVGVIGEGPRLALQVWAEMASRNQSGCAVGGCEIGEGNNSGCDGRWPGVEFGRVVGMEHLSAERRLWTAIGNFVSPKGRPEDLGNEIDERLALQDRVDELNAIVEFAKVVGARRSLVTRPTLVSRQSKQRVAGLDNGESLGCREELGHEDPASIIIEKGL